MQLTSPLWSPYMAVDIKNLNSNQLNDLISKAQLRQDELRKEKVVKLRQKVNALLKAEGYTFEDVFGPTRKARRSGSKVPPKYRNPANPAQTWSGRGKRPHWFNDALKAGKKQTGVPHPLPGGRERKRHVDSPSCCANPGCRPWEFGRFGSIKTDAET